MRNYEGGGTAFPAPSRTEMKQLESGRLHEVKIPATDGMTLRDYFAARVAAGDAASGDGWGPAASEQHFLDRARTYYAIADAMLQVRDEKK